MINVIEIVEVNNLKVEDGVLHVPVRAQLDGADGQITLRLDVDTAENLQARLSAGIITARMQLRRR